MQEIFGEYRITFLEETKENLERLNDDLISFENNPKDTRILDDIFRLVHTLKSSAAAVGMDSLSVFAHEMENLIQKLKSGSIETNTDIVDILFSAFDQIQSFIELAWDNREEEIDFQGLIRKIQGYHQVEEKEISENTNQKETYVTYTLSPVEKELIRQKKGKPYLIHIQIDSHEPLKSIRAELVLNRLMKIGEVVHIFPEKDSLESSQFSGFFSVILTSRQVSAEIKKNINIDLIESIRIQQIKNIDAPLKVHQEKTSGGTTSTQHSMRPSEKNVTERRMTTDNSIRVPVKKLDEMLHLVGELVIITSGLKLLEKRLKEVVVHETLAHEMNVLDDKLIKISADLHRCALKTRMLPVDTLFNQYLRVVRDLSKQENKEVELVIKGGETEVDKKVIDVLNEAVTHLIRNAVNHGIETPEERIQKNKTPMGRIDIRARQSGNHILISIKDDGCGIDFEAVKRKAIESGYFLRDASSAINETELLSLLFETGFSTSEKISSISGRGVGLDVVRNAVNSLNGTVSVNTKSGIGTEFLITLPLTLTITTVFVVESNGQNFGIPISDIREAVKISATRIEQVECASALNLNNRIVPVAGLSDVLENSHGKISPDKNGLVPIIILSYAEREIGLIVDQIIGKQEIVLKSLEKNYKSIRGLSGAAILGDGNIILVIDTLKTIQIFREQNKTIKMKTSETIKS